MRPSLACLAALLLTTLHAVTARAQPPSEVESADGLFRSAKAAMDRGDLARACPEFTESLRLDPAPGTLLNLGECEARSGKVATGLGHFQEGRTALPPGDYRVAFADERIADLSRRVPRLAVTWKGELGPTTHVQRDGVDVSRSTLGVALRVDPGKHVLVVTVDSAVVARKEVTLREGEVRTVTLAPDMGSTAGPAGEDRPGSSQRTAGIVVASAGGVGLVAGLVVGIVAKLTYDSALSNCPTGPGSCNGAGISGGQTAHTQASIATALVSTGLVLGAGGAALYVLAPRERGVAIAPFLGPTSAGLRVGGAW
jgi:hypothetical protein